MPYYDVVNINETGFSEFRSVSKTTGVETIPFGGGYLRSGSKERGFRTFAPKATSVKRVDDKVADPYSWFTDLNAVKVRAAIKGGFDPTAFRADVGHPWSLEKFEFRGATMDYAVNNTSWTVSRYFRGFPFQNSSTPGLQSTYYVPPLSDLHSWAALKYGQMAPTSDRFSAPAFVGELREGLPRIVTALASAKTKTSKLRAVGSDYLNVQFGWLPLLNDLISIAETLYSATQGLFKPWGATHRSRGENPTTSTLDAEKLPWNGSISIGDYYDDAAFQPYLDGTGGRNAGYVLGTSTVHTAVTTRRWIEGEYVYLPKAGFEQKDYLEKFNTLVKTDLTPSDLWQLAPWSWLVDWFFDIGKAIEAFETATSNRVLSTYCYAMEETTSTTQALMFDIAGGSGVVYTGPKAWSGQWEYSRKRRIRANPFGFTLNPESALTGAQFLILGALGLTKIRR